MSGVASTLDHPVSCPCKKIKFNLSIFTAATLGATSIIKNKDIKLVAARSSGGSSYYHSLPTDDYGYTPLHLAAQNNSTDIVTHLMALLLRGNSGGDGALSEAVCHRDAPLESTTPLHRCCYSGGAECLHLLLPHVQAAELLLGEQDTGSRCPETALHKSVKAGRFKCTYLLLRRAASLGMEVLRAMLALEGDWGMYEAENSEVDPASHWNDVAGGCGDSKICVAVLDHFLNNVLRAGGEGVGEPYPSSSEITIELALPCERSDPTQSWREQFEKFDFGGGEKVEAAGGGEVTETETEERAAVKVRERPMGARCSACGEEGVSFKKVGDRLVCRGCFRSGKVGA
jgi:hypothetical protein